MGPATICSDVRASRFVLLVWRGYILDADVVDVIVVAVWWRCNGR